MSIFLKIASTDNICLNLGVRLYRATKPTELSLFSEHTKILLSRITESEIDNYVDIGEAKKCAGGYMIEGVGSEFDRQN